MNPYFSLIVLTYERLNALKRCLQSIKEQSFDRTMFEVIVVDDGSKLSNQSVIDDFKESLQISYVYQKHQGVGVARNTGIKHARGPLVGFIADDYCLPKDYLFEADNFFKNYPQAYVVSFNILSCGKGLGAMVQQLYTQLALWWKIDEKYYGDKIIVTKLPASRAAIFKREAFEKVGRFSENIPGGEDVELASRLLKNNIPVYFLAHIYIQHWEEKTFLGFLRQRYHYGSYSPSLTHQGKFFRIFRSLVFTYRSLFHVAQKRKQQTLFLVLTPGVILFIFSYFLGVYGQKK